MANRFYAGRARKRSNAKTPQLFGKETFAMQLDEGISQQLQALGENFVDQYCRPAAFVASTVLYDEMRLRVPVKTGLLKKSIYRYREKTETNKRSIFYVGPNKRIAPHWWWAEFGHFVTRRVYFDEDTQQFITTKEFLANPYMVAARPYIRPTYDAKMNAALQAGLAELKRRLKNNDPFIATGNDL
jgi:hypothetical protein